MARSQPDTYSDEFFSILSYLLLSGEETVPINGLLNGAQETQCASTSTETAICEILKCSSFVPSAFLGDKNAERK